MFKYLILKVVASALGLQGWRSMFNNFAVEQISIDSVQMGILQ
ncbi:MAG: hypothetical protein ACK5MG_07275 [Bacteroidales bacterium]